MILMNIYTHLQYFKEEHPNAEPGDDVDSFKFVQPNGVLQLLLQTPQQLGWSVNPERKPMKVHVYIDRTYCITMCVCIRYFNLLLTSFHQIHYTQVVVWQCMLKLVLLKNHFVVLLN